MGSLIPPGCWFGWGLHHPLCPGSVGLHEGCVALGVPVCMGFVPPGFPMGKSPQTQSKKQPEPPGRSWFPAEAITQPVLTPELAAPVPSRPPQKARPRVKLWLLLTYRALWGMQPPGFL
ncbi:protein tilB-like protein [Platysternon megacephalum]|uniref:Protein tilB-like protein n=1 Tax=Platysternon megacephalum TaxID=55544 RepID=A0A4D9ELE1_9SAUR|nr:protein tilB-like protein [Platysternon megacephalum]